MTPASRLFRLLHKTAIDAIQAGRADEAARGARQLASLAHARSATSATRSETLSRTPSDPAAGPTGIAMKTTDDPLIQAQQVIATARQAFASDVDALLHNWAVYSATLGEAIGEVSRTEALRALRVFVLERFDHHLALPAVEDD